MGVEGVRVGVEAQGLVYTIVDTFHIEENSRLTEIVVCLDGMFILDAHALAQSGG